MDFRAAREGWSAMPPSTIDRLFAEMLHHGDDSLAPGDPLAPPIVPASVYHLPGDPAGAYQYGRWANPSWSALEEALAVLEQAETVLFPSGMAAIAALFYTQLRPGDRLLLPADGYHTTRLFAETYLAGAGIAVERAATADLQSQPLDGLRLLFIETPSNPGLDVCDLAPTIAKAQAANCLVVVDNTTATPLGQRPLDLGADAVMSADTKAINGHSDALLGHVASRNAELIEQIRNWRKIAGAIPGSFEAWLVHRGLKTLDVRHDRMCASAQTIAERLREHGQVRELRYPGLSTDPAHPIAKRQMVRFGSLIAFTLASKEHAERFISAAKFVRAATSFGGVQTSAERRARWGDKVADGFLRLSIGCEPVEALWADIEAALDSL
jgi:cystathionine gamma-lyase